MGDDPTMRSWVRDQILEALTQADLARAAAADLDDHVLMAAAVRLAEDLEAFARRFAARLVEMG